MFFNFLYKAKQEFMLGDDDKIVAVEYIHLKKNILHTANCVTDLSSNL